MKKNAVSVIAVLFSLFFLVSSAFAIFCSQCGTKNDDSARFCSGCGTKLAGAGKSGTPQETGSAVAEQDIIKTVEKVAPSVVLVRILKNELNAQMRDVGSGFVVRKDGYIITNAHVVDDPEDIDKINVVMSDKKEFEAKVILRDYATDLAVLKISADNLAPVILGDINKVSSGDKVFVVGNPMGLEKSTSSGIISAKDRYLGSYEYEGLLQTDAAVNPGNSGGPLFNSAGEVVGVTSLGMSKTYSEGLNFAIPVFYVADVLKYATVGKIKRPWIGIAVQDLTPNLKQWLSLAYEKTVTDSEGAYISSVAGGRDLQLKKGDIVIKLNEEPVKKAWDLQSRILLLKAGEEISISVKRQEKIMDFRVKLGEKPAQIKFPIDDEADLILGITFDQDKMKIKKVRAKSLGSSIGLKIDDEISQIVYDRKSGGVRVGITDMDSFSSAFDKVYNREKRKLEAGIVRSYYGMDYPLWVDVLTAISST